MTLPDDVSIALRQVQQTWKGCDWVTEFGPRKANLQGLCSRQAKLAAAATRGEESNFWKDVSEYLEVVERDAAAAASLACEGVELWQMGREEDALSRLDEASALEQRYRTPSRYADLRAMLSRRRQTLIES